MNKPFLVGFAPHDDGLDVSGVIWFGHSKSCLIDLDVAHTNGSTYFLEADRAT